MNEVIPGSESVGAVQAERRSLEQGVVADRNKPLGPRLLLHAEGATLFVACVAAYAMLGGNWWLFLVLLLAPDLSMLGYLAGNRIGAFVYNAVHAYPLPALLGAFGLLAAQPLATWLALIWLAHIGMDRTVGYGLKYTTAFKDTHLARV